ncbi:MAG: DUF4363 family protein [Betaproteobacteria bacterium]
MDDRVSSDERAGGNSGEQVSAGGGTNGNGSTRGARDGNNRRGRVNTSAWIIGALVVIVAVFAGLRYARVPAPSRPAPTRPSPTTPAPSPTRPAPTQPSPTTQAPTVTDLERNLNRVEDAVRRKDWTAADRESSTLRTTWESLRPRVTSTNTTKDVTTFDTRVDRLRANIRAKNEAGARTDLTELKTTARKFKVAPTRGTTSG